MEYYSALKRNLSQAQKDKYYIILLMWVMWDT